MLAARTTSGHEAGALGPLGPLGPRGCTAHGRPQGCRAAVEVSDWAGLSNVMSCSLQVHSWGYGRLRMESEWRVTQLG